MKIKVIKGTNQIGGAIVAITSKKAQIIIDFGCDLPSQEREEKEAIVTPEIQGLTYGKSIYDAVFITHSHSDHIGLIAKINKDIPIYVEEKSKKIFELCNDFTNIENKEVKTLKFTFNKPIIIKDMKITPFRTDHSAYNSAMFLIESEEKRILHTGDFRGHGRKSEEFKNIIKNIGKINCLITEGTCFSRDSIKNMKEESLEIEATRLFQNYNQVFILESSTNIDRLVSFYKASTRTNKMFIEDLFTATIAMNLKGIPTPSNFKNVSIWIPKKYNRKSREFKEKYINNFEKYKNSKVFHGDFAMIVKQSMFEDIKTLKEKGLITNACLVYSMWNGYKEQANMKEFLEAIKSFGIKIYTLHTSGHADIDTMKWLEKTLNPDIVIPIHTAKKVKAKEIFKNAKILEDREELNI